MNKSQYQSYLSTYTWRLLRAKAFNIHGKKCKKCGAQKNLHIHHRTYVRVGGAEDVLKDLVPLCDECHETIHEKVHNEGLTISEATRIYLGEPPPKPARKNKKIHFEPSHPRLVQNLPPLRNKPRKNKKTTPIDLAKLKAMYGLDTIPAFLMNP